MLRELNPVTARGSRRAFRKGESALRVTCLLCRILLPIVVQHRHLVFDYSSEANTVLFNPMRPRELRDARGCSHQSRT